MEKLKCFEWHNWCYCPHLCVLCKNQRNAEIWNRISKGIIELLPNGFDVDLGRTDNSEWKMVFSLPILNNGLKRCQSHNGNGPPIHWEQDWKQNLFRVTKCTVLLCTLYYVWIFYLYIIDIIVACLWFWACLINIHMWLDLQKQDIIAYFRIPVYWIYIIYIVKCIYWQIFSFIFEYLGELQPYKVATTKQSICTARIGEINYKHLQKWLLLANGLRCGATIFAIMLAMNRGIDCFISYSSFFTAFKGEIHEEKSITYDHFNMTNKRP